MHRQTTTAFHELGTVALKQNLIQRWVQVDDGKIHINTYSYHPFL